MDFRGHGASKKPEGDEDMSIETLIQDVFEFFEFLRGKYPESTFVLMGHSLGGSVACNAAKRLEGMEDEGRRLRGLVVIDVSEGSLWRLCRLWLRF